MALQFRATAAALSKTITKPTGTVEGDKMVADIFLDNHGTAATGPAGWIKEEEVIVSGGNSYQHAIFTKEAGGSEPANYTFVTTGSAPNSQITTYYDDVGGGTWVAAPTNGTSIANNGTVASSTTSAVDVLDGDILHCAWGCDGNRAVVTPPASMTSIATTPDAGNSNNLASYREAISADSTGETRTLVWDSSPSVEQTTAGAIVLQYTPAAGGPLLTLPTGTTLSDTVASGTVTTDTDNGTLYSIVSTSATPPSVVQIQAGQDHTGSAAVWSGNELIDSIGIKTFTASGLTASTAYYFHYQQQNSDTDDSTVSTSAQFTTGAVPIPVITDITPDPVITNSSTTITAAAGLEAVQGTGSATQTIDGVTIEVSAYGSWADTSATVTSVDIEADDDGAGNQLKYGEHTWTVENDSVQSDTFLRDVSPATDNGFENLTSIATVGQLVTAAGTLAIGDQIRYEGLLHQGGSPTIYSVTVNADATYSYSGATSDGSYTFDVRAWDDTDQTWGTIGTQNVQVGPVAAGGGACGLCIGIGIGI